MPNWCTNYVTITGPEKVIERLLQRAKRSFVRESGEMVWDKKTKKTKLVFSKKKVTPKVFSFHNFIPMPNEVAKTPSGGFQEPLQSRVRAMEKANRKKYGAPNWYDWACNHWGTKWDVVHDEIEVRREEGRVRFEFNTAWGPPDPVFEEMARQYPSLRIHNVWEEEGGETGRGMWGPDGENVRGADQVAVEVRRKQAESDAFTEALRQRFDDPKKTLAGSPS